MLTCDSTDTWTQFLEYVKNKCSQTAFENWFSNIKVISSSSEKITVEVPNVFVKEYVLENYRQDLCSFIPITKDGQPSIEFVIEEQKKGGYDLHQTPSYPVYTPDPMEESLYELKLNPGYQFENFIEGPSNQFVKSAAMGIANRPGSSYNPLFVHGGVGLGKTHLLHGIGHYIRKHHKKLKVQCITTEAFINDLVDSLRNKSVDKMKKFYRSLDILLVDDIQFLQNRLNFEEEFCNTFESLINANKQVVITSDKPPGMLKLSERIVGRMEWGLVAHVGVPDLETRVAILQHKASQRNLQLSSEIAFLIAENVSENVRQLEGAINKLTAHCRLLGKNLSIDLVENTIGELFQKTPKQKVSIDSIFKSVATVFDIRISDLKGTSRTKDVALARQVAMFLAKEIVPDSLNSIGASFGKTHSTILHAYKTIEKKMAKDESLRKHISHCKRNLTS